uniref:Uncharacterized protein n=1 Tax=Arundo donax TaxID=35708 RepID=A0A0A9BPC4_ARUDO
MQCCILANTLGRIGCTKIKLQRFIYNQQVIYG